MVNKLAKKRREREQFINRLINVLLKRLEAVGITAEIQGRPKHLYSIYHKMKEQKKDFNEIYDLTAIRVIVDSVKDCYGALGTVHACLLYTSGLRPQPRPGPDCHRSSPAFY